MSIWTERGEDVPFYRLLLRPIGAYLDDQGAGVIHLVETPEGFSVRHGTGNRERPLQCADFSRPELVDAHEKQKAKRGSVQRGDEVREMYGDDNSYQEVLRSLGHELDRLGAYAIALDELEGQFLLTYTFQDPTRGLSWNKRMALVGPEERTRFVQEARLRRAPDVEVRRRRWFR